MAQIVVIGLGRFAHNVALELHTAGCEVLAIEPEPEVAGRIADRGSPARLRDL